MVEQAQEFIRRQTGTYYNLFNQPPEQNLEDFIGKLSNSQISVDGPEVVFGRLFDHVGYDAIGGCSVHWFSAVSLPREQVENS